MKWSGWIVLALCLMFAILRFTLPVHGLNFAATFKDLAHLFVGGVFGAAIATRRKDLWAMAGALTAAEVVAFFARRV